jgi:hydrogenase expression/formation protein HypC
MKHVDEYRDGALARIDPDEAERTLALLAEAGALGAAVAAAEARP